MVNKTEMATPENTDEESGEAFTDGDFEDTDDELIERKVDAKIAIIPVNETINTTISDCDANELDGEVVNIVENSETNGGSESENVIIAAEDDLSDEENNNNLSIIGILGDQRSHVRTPRNNYLFCFGL